ncbi:ribonuclease H-like domain-containing protein [Aspergillus carlsbadensis]|nr:ribonuclease H-like domain-containing protein [Aspergillus carlsbadensis]
MLLLHYDTATPHIPSPVYLIPLNFPRPRNLPMQPSMANNSGNPQCKALCIACLSRDQQMRISPNFHHFPPRRLHHDHLHSLNSNLATQHHRLPPEMVYIIDIYADGGCRGNGQPGAIGAAAIIFKKRKSRWRPKHSVALPRNPPPTNQRAELTAIILALEKALEQYDKMLTHPQFYVTIHVDSRYAIGCMTEWIYKWKRNGWVNAAGFTVVNKDLIMRASKLDAELKRLGSVSYVWVPREENWRADELCNENMDCQYR